MLIYPVPNRKAPFVEIGELNVSSMRRRNVGEKRVTKFNVPRDNMCNQGHENGS